MEDASFDVINPPWQHVCPNVLVCVCRLVVCFVCCLVIGSKYTDVILFNKGDGSTVLYDPEGTAVGYGYEWRNAVDKYGSPTLYFRINRKSVGVEFDGELRV